MKPFTPLTRKQDSRPVRYLVVDDSVFARKSLAKMIESFGGELAGEAIGDRAGAMAGLNIGVRLVKDQRIRVRRADAGE